MAKKGKIVIHYFYCAIVQICLSGRVSISDVWKLVKVGYLIAIITIHDHIHRSISSFLLITRSSWPSMWPSMNNFQSSLSIWSLITRSASPSMRPSTAPVLPEEWVLNLFIFIQGEKVVRRKVSIINTPFIFFDDFWFLIKTFPAAKGNTCGGKDASSLTSCMQSFVV